MFTIAAGVVLGLLAFKLIEALFEFLGVTASIVHEEIQDRWEKPRFMSRKLGDLWFLKVCVGLVMAGMVWILFHPPYSLPGH
jgi:hypothetical protein